MIKRTLLAAAIFSTLPAYAGLTSITAGYDFTDYSGDHGNRNLAYDCAYSFLESDYPRYSSANCGETAINLPILRIQTIFFYL